MFDKVKRFLGDVGLEGKRITWPSRHELVDSTFVVIVFIVLLAIVIMACDEVIRTALKMILGGQA
ncbi:MAG: preprotein translocase subunit SecE [Kiritimatiellia bacterium]